MRSGEDLGAPRAFILGGNAHSLAFISGLSSDDETVVAYMVPMAQTPAGNVCGLEWQQLTLAQQELLDWIDRTFPASDERAFVAPARDIELLARVEWNVAPPQRLDETAVLNVDDIPDDVLEALAAPPATLVQCAACRRLCVRGDFVWKERELCAWDFHRHVFGRRGPWQTGTCNEHFPDGAPRAAYVAPPLVEESGAHVIMFLAQELCDVASDVLNAVIAQTPGLAYMAVRTPDGLTVLREGA